jgi:hypothetical protein
LAADIPYPKWLDLTLEDPELVKSGISGANMPSDYAEYFREQNLSAIKSYINDEFSRHGRVYKDVEGMSPDDTPFEKRIKWLCKTSRVSGMIYDELDNRLYFMAGIKNVLKRYNVEVDKAYQSIENFASICGFEPIRKQLERGRPTTRAAWVDMEQFIRLVSREDFKEANPQMTIVDVC